MTNRNLPWEGGCRCGKVRLRVGALPLLTMACHCTGCQRMSASAFSLSAAIPSGGFSVTQGEPVIGGMHGASRHYFCPHCMSWMFTRPEGLDWFVNLRPTMLDDPGWFSPFVETWTSEKLAWATTGAMHSFPQLPAMDQYDELIRGYASFSARPTTADKRRAFFALHEAGCFVIPNPWDVGSPRFLQGLGFKALATTSSGFAWSQGRPDGAISRDMALAHLRDIVEATDLPVNADFESGFANDASGVAESVSLAVETGVAGLSIEDSTGDAAKPLFEIGEAVERIRAARRAIDKAGGDTLLVGRAECFLVGLPDLDETITRLKAYSHAGADCLYAPGLRTRDQIATVVAAVAPKPLNLLVGSVSDLTIQAIAQLGVRRVSVGGALARSAWGGFIHTSRSLAEAGTFDGFADAAPGNELNTFFRDDLKNR